MTDVVPPTALESAVLQRFHDLYRGRGFPSTLEIQIARRTYTPCGRYLDLDCRGPLDIEDGYVDLDGACIEMIGLPAGIMAVVLIKDKRVRLLEMTSYGGHAWNGDELGWRIV